MELVGWAPGFPMEPAGTELFGGGGWPQTSVPSSSGGQLIEYAGAIQHDPIDKAAQEFEVDFRNMEMKIDNNPIHVFEKEARAFKVDIDMMRMKIHKYPPSIRPLGEGQWFTTVPKLVAMGPYITTAWSSSSKQRRPNMWLLTTASWNQATQSRRCTMRSPQPRTYMVSRTEGPDKIDPSLRGFLDFNRKAIRQDIMLLENQIPWQVVEAVMRFRPVRLADFVSLWTDYLQDRKHLEEKPFVLDDSYEPPHLLGLVRFYIVGKSSTKVPATNISSISVSVGAIELAQIGMKLTANRTTELIHMGVNKRGTLLAELSLTPLSLDDERASFLINMAALELCTTSNFQEAEDEDSAVCSYLLLLSMLVHREEDVQELRTKQLLQGGAGLVNKDALDFFTSLQSLPLRGSSCFVRVMVEIEKYKVHRRMKIKVYAFLYKNKKTVFTVFTIFGVLVSIIGTLMSLKTRLVL